jgi:hypothetical protein
MEWLTHQATSSKNTAVGAQTAKQMPTRSIRSQKLKLSIDGCG